MSASPKSSSPETLILLCVQDWIDQTANTHFNLTEQIKVVRFLGFGTCCLE
ncbi:hypothetical protein HanXRQr2_Chr14g0648431 [Helianthus annuus]|uniref:Uncharacterized protein n=1 Tax=Helianthus annuus TaxID=4232 RepID=A0A251SIC9_HELAN|nr:hypothetical protein HanXRQr2_Chr14g0648431 [Helianthus annuus]